MGHKYYFCEMCHKRITRNKHQEHHNIEQKPTIHHFCSHGCKMVWISMVRETGKMPMGFHEIIGYGVRENG